MRPLLLSLAIAGALAAAAHAQARVEAVFFNLMDEAITIRVDDGQSCSLMAGDDECGLNLTMGQHEVKIETQYEILTGYIDVQASGNRFWVAAEGIARH